MSKLHATKTAQLDQLAEFNLHELESRLTELEKYSNHKDPTVKSEISALRQAIHKRQRKIKSEAIEFELTNDHHLLIFDPTNGFSKIAGNSVLFYAFTIADRLHRRYNIKNDTDSYSCSREGIISVKKLPELETSLININILPDTAISTPELHFYKLPKVYKESGIATLRDRLMQDIKQISEIITPDAPVPELYTLILETHRAIFYNCSRITDNLFRTTLADPIISLNNHLILYYLNFANPAPRLKYTPGVPTFSFFSNKLDLLASIIFTTRELRNQFACLENVRLIHHRELRLILENLVEIERITRREYLKHYKRNSKTTTTPCHSPHSSTT